MIRSEPYGGGVRWHCTKCDTGRTAPGFNVPVISWTNGPPPETCPKCNPHYEWVLKFEVEVLIPEERWGKVRDKVAAREADIADAIRKILGGRDARCASYIVKHRRSHG